MGERMKAMKAIGVIAASLILGFTLYSCASDEDSSVSTASSDSFADDSVTKMNVHYCLTALSYIKDKTEMQNIKIQNRKRWAIKEESEVII